jgi:hypothetical protein
MPLCFVPGKVCQAGGSGIWKNLLILLRSTYLSNSSAIPSVYLSNKPQLLPNLEKHIQNNQLLVSELNLGMRFEVFVLPSTS